MRQLVLDFLYQKKSYGTQFFYSSGVDEGLAKFAETKGLPIDRIRDEKLFRETFWKLCGEGLVCPGYNHSNQNLPHISITDYGIKCFEEGKILPYDPEGFLNSLYANVKNIDDVIKMYFEEAVKCFIGRNYLSAVVMVGGAIEKTVIVLTEEIYKLIDIAEQPDYQKKILDQWKIKIKFDNLLKFLSEKGYKHKLGRTSQEKLDSTLPAIVNIVRITRNETGHPTGREVYREEAEGEILLAKEGVIFMYKLLDELT